MDSEADGADEQWLPVGNAAALTGIAERTIYNWLKSHRLASRSEDGVVKVELGALRAIAAHRPRANGRAGAGNTAGNGLGSGKVAAEDGAVASRLFSLFESGVPPATVVQQECLPPKVVLENFRAFTALRELGHGTGRPSLEARVAALETRLEEWINGMGEDLAGVIHQANQLLPRVEKVERHIAEIPVPARGQFRCQHCKATGYPEVYVRCGGCGQHHGTWGFRR